MLCYGLKTASCFPPYHVKYHSANLVQRKQIDLPNLPPAFQVPSPHTHHVTSGVMLHTSNSGFHSAPVKPYLSGRLSRSPTPSPTRSPSSSNEACEALLHKFRSGLVLALPAFVTLKRRLQAGRFRTILSWLGSNKLVGVRLLRLLCCAHFSGGERWGKVMGFRAFVLGCVVCCFRKVFELL